ncbi:MAG: MFS transporter [Chloroflexi bacterium]|nr:MFS transporter [Chloroflexota bacterium]
MAGLGREEGVQVPVALQLLSMASFRWLWPGNGLALMGFQIRNMGQAWITLDLTGGSQFWVGVVNGTPAITIMLFSILGGVAADRLPRQRILILTRMTLAWLAFATAFLPAAQLLAIWMLIAFIGIQFVFFFLVALYFGAFAAVSLLNLPQEEPRPPRPILGDLVEGLKYVAKTPQVAWLMLMASLLIFAGMYLPMVLVYARDVLKVGPQGFGYLEAVFGVGSLVGLASIAWMGGVRRKGPVIVVAATTVGASMIVFVVWIIYPMTLPAQFVIGVGAAFWITSVTTVLQTTVPDEMRGRVMGVYFMVIQLMGFGWIIGGYMAQTLGNVNAVLIGGFAFMGLNLLAYVSSKSIREIN